MKAQFVTENINFEKSSPNKSLRIGKYRPQNLTVKDYEGNEHNIEVIDNEFNLIDLKVRVEFKEDLDIGETFDVYIDGQKSDMNVFKMEPFDYEFKKQGEHSKPGWTDYGFSIAKNEEHLKQLKDENSYWHISSMDYTMTGENPFIVIAEMILYTY